MASVSGVGSNNISSLYGNRNVLSGLASGMDTESMIENAVSGYQLKISGLQQKQTLFTWKQDSYRSITDQLVAFSQKYTSYSSSTNLLSSSFFNNATITTAGGANAEHVSATGKTNSNVQINGVAQLATAGRYQVSGQMGVLASIAQASDGSRAIESSKSVNLSGTTDISNLSGTMTIKYGNQSVSITFGEEEIFSSAQEFADAINQKLADTTITYSSGNTSAADEAIKVTVDSSGKIQFTDKKNSGNDVYINHVSGNLANTFRDVTFNATNKISSLNLSGKNLKSEVAIMKQISGKTMTFSLDGSSKQIILPTEEELDSYRASNSHSSREEALTAYLQEKLTKAFGRDKINVTNLATDGGLQLSFSVPDGSNLSISSTANSALELDSNATTSLNTGKTLGELLGSNLGGLTGGTLLLAKGAVTKQSDGSYLDTAGNLCNASGQRLGSDKELLYGFDLVINGETIGTYTRDTALETVLTDINKNTEAGVSVSYSKTTNQFVFTTNETGAGFGIEFGGDLATKIFGAFDASKYTEGKDAIINMTVNGTDMTVSRSSNTFDVDGLSITVNGTFNGEMNGTIPVFDAEMKDPVTFTTKADADKITNAIKSFIEDINGIMKAIREAYSTLPAQKSNGSKYMPLTDADKESMTESAIKAYEENAKQGLLFGDSDLSSLYRKLLSAITPTGNDGADLRVMGITTSYSEGLTTLSLDENKLRDMLNTNPDAVTDAFTKAVGEGSATNGMMVNIKTQLDAYASVQGSTKGILVNKAGSKYSSLSLLKNSLQTQIENCDTQIKAWQSKLSTKVDYYTRQFTRLEQLVAEMNAQSSSLSGLMMTGGTGQ